MDAPECVVCGKREWRHVCGYVAKDKVTHNQPNQELSKFTKREQRSECKPTHKLTPDGEGVCKPTRKPTGGCIGCAEKDAEIEGLKVQNEYFVSAVKALRERLKRDAEYMKLYRAVKGGRAEMVVTKTG